jgi:hypothetical protein
VFSSRALAISFVSSVRLDLLTSWTSGRMHR